MNAGRPETWREYLTWLRHEATGAQRWTAVLLAAGLAVAVAGPAVLVLVVVGWAVLGRLRWGVPAPGSIGGYTVAIAPC